MIKITSTLISVFLFSFVFLPTISSSKAKKQRTIRGKQLNPSVALPKADPGKLLTDRMKPLGSLMNKGTPMDYLFGGPRKEDASKPSKKNKKQENSKAKIEKVQKPKTTEKVQKPKKDEVDEEDEVDQLIEKFNANKISEKEYTRETSNILARRTGNPELYERPESPSPSTTASSKTSSATTSPASSNYSGISETSPMPSYQESQAMPSPSPTSSSQISVSPQSSIKSTSPSRKVSTSDSEGGSLDSGKKSYEPASNLYASLAIEKDNKSQKYAFSARASPQTQSKDQLPSLYPDDDGSEDDELEPGLTGKKTPPSTVTIRDLNEDARARNELENSLYAGSYNPYRNSSSNSSSSSSSSSSSRSSSSPTSQSYFVDSGQKAIQRQKTTQSNLSGGYEGEIFFLETTRNAPTGLNRDSGTHFTIELPGNLRPFRYLVRRKQEESSPPVPVSRPPLPKSVRKKPAAWNILKELSLSMNKIARGTERMFVKNFFDTNYVHLSLATLSDESGEPVKVLSCFASLAVVRQVGSTSFAHPCIVMPHETDSRLSVYMYLVDNFSDGMPYAP